MSAATGVDVAAEAAFDRCMNAERPNWPGGKPDLSSALPLSIIPAKVNPGMGKTCWVAADPCRCAQPRQSFAWH